MLEKKRVILFTIKDEQEEIRSLIDTMGYEIVEVFYQKRNRPDPNYFLGKGKLDEVKEFLGIEVSDEDKELNSVMEKVEERKREKERERKKEENAVDMVIVDATLKPGQHYRIESGLGIECVDRIGLILSIFKEHAHTREAKLQVELARLQYQLPFMKEWIHRGKEGEKPGFMGGGAYDVDVYYSMAKRRISRIKGIFREIEKDREVKREIRRRGNTTIVALAGYTNAGKSTLLKTLTGDDDIYVDDKLFATLSPLTRRAKDRKKPILFTDTVGFIDNLPTETVEAFMSTLEEIFEADLVLLVLDISDSEEEIRRKMKASLDILLPDVSNDRIIYVANKVDLLSEREKESKISFVRDVLGNDALLLSAISLDAAGKVIRAVYSRIKKGRNRVFISLPAEREETYRIIGNIKKMVIVSSIDFRDQNMEITAYALREKIDYLEHLVKEVKGEMKVFPEKDDTIPLYA